MSSASAIRRNPAHRPICHQPSCRIALSHASQDEQPSADERQQLRVVRRVAPRHGAWAGYSSFSTALGPQRQEPHVLEHEQSIDNQ